MFGTFQPEEEKPDYGILKPVGSYNPVYLVFHECVDITKDLFKYRSPKAWWRILFGSPSMTMDKDKYYGEGAPFNVEDALGPLNPQTVPVNTEARNPAELIEK